MPAALTYRYRSPYFKHLRQRQLRLGLLHLRAEVLDADGF